MMRRDPVQTSELKPSLLVDERIQEPSSPHPDTAVAHKFVWSDDESSSEHSNGKKKERQLDRTTQLINRNTGLDEFAAGVVDFRTGGGSIQSTSSSEEGNDYSEKDPESEATEDDDVGLQHDVESNLQVLSQLFPEFSKQEPLKTDADVDDDAGNETTNKPTPTSGWGAMGQMLRFDPTNPQSANQFVLDDGEGEDDDSRDANRKQTSSALSSSSSSSAEEDEEVPMDKSIEPPDDNIYEQGKLEQVFKEVRESSHPLIAETTTGGGSGFSFGFDLTPATTVGANDAPASGAFSFSFSVPDANSRSERAETKDANQGDVGEDGMLGDAATGDHPPAASPRRRRRAFAFPTEEDLDKHVRHFYCLNDGARIMEDLEGWRNDPAVHERWMKERFTLTQDWKRKRKYALSKKQKRNR